MNEGLALLDAAYDLSLDREGALDALATAASTELGDRYPLFAWEIPASCDFSGLHAMRVVVRVDDRVIPIAREVATRLPPGADRAGLCGDPCFWSFAERFAGTRALAAARALGMPDTGIVHAPGGTGLGVNIVACVPATEAWPAARRDHWGAVAAHVGAAWRLRSALAPAVAAELRVDGEPRLLAPGMSSSAREALRRAVRQREAVRGAAGSADRRPLWPELVAGRWSLVDEHTAGGTRHVVAYENPAGAAHLRALQPRERMILALALAGRSSKWIALELGLSQPTVARCLQRALRQLGAARLSSLAGVQAAVFEPLDVAGGCLAAATVDTTVRIFGILTPAEIAVAEAALAGRSDATIAAQLGKSPRTVAHQLTAICRKLGVSSRRELLTRLD